MRLREAMLPYNYSLGWEAHTTGMPMARPLWLAFPGQADAYTNNAEYMWGDSLLVAPVTVAGTTAGGPENESARTNVKKHCCYTLPIKMRLEARRVWEV